MLWIVFSRCCASSRTGLMTTYRYSFIDQDPDCTGGRCESTTARWPMLVSGRCEVVESYGPASIVCENAKELSSHNTSIKLVIRGIEIPNKPLGSETWNIHDPIVLRDWYMRKQNLPLRTEIAKSS